jgi:hypothetical protein
MIDLYCYLTLSITNHINVLSYHKHRTSNSPFSSICPYINILHWLEAIFVSFVFCHIETEMRLYIVSCSI